MSLSTLNATLGVLAKVEVERDEQDAKWGQQNHAPIEWMAILQEEVGEAAKEAMEHHFAGRFYPEDPDRLARYRAELVQVAAVAVAAIESLDRNEGRKGDH